MVMINGFTTTGTNYGLKQAILLIICVLIVPALSQTCGDGNFVVATQGCNDGNTIDGDGCNSTCQVQKSYSCVNTVGSVSICRVNVAVNLTYVGTIRDTSANAATIYFTILPFYAAFTRISFDGLLSHSLPNCTIKSSIYSQSEKVLKINFYYSSDLQESYQTFTILFNNTQYFWNASTTQYVQISGVNCEITYNTELWVHNVLQYVYLILMCVAILIFNASIFWEKWIGLELLQTYQTVFFLLALMEGYPFQFSPAVQYMRYSNGYDDVLTAEFYRTYTLSQPLNAMGIQKQFLCNYNIMFVLSFSALFIIIILSLVRKRYNAILEQEQSSKISAKLLKIQKAISFLFSRVFVMLTLGSMFKIIFSFCLQLSTENAVTALFEDEVNITFGVVAFVTLFAVISFVLFWFLLLPANFSEDQQHMSLSFQNMSFYYPVMYLGYQSLFILTLSIFYRRSYSIYMVFGLQVVYFFMLIWLRPYNTIRRLNKLVHNATIIINQLAGILASAMIIRWNSIIGTSYQKFQSDYQMSVFSFAILILLIVCCTLAIVRLAIFNKDVTGCCKKQQMDDEDQLVKSNTENMKKIMDEEKVKILADNNRIIEANLQQKRSGEIKRKDTVNRPTQNQEQFLDNNQDVNKYLNDKYIVWAQSKVDEGPPNRGRNIKKSNPKKQAQMIKTLVEEYTQINNMRKQEQQMMAMREKRERE